MANNKKVKFIILKLKGHALIWWKQLQNRRVRHGKEKIRTSERIKEKMRDNFLPSAYRQTVFKKFLNLKQNNKIVAETTATKMKSKV